MQSGHQFNPSNIQYSPRSKRIKSSGEGGKFSQKEVELSETPLYFAEDRMRGSPPSARLLS